MNQNTDTPTPPGRTRSGLTGYIDVLFSGGLSDIAAWSVVVLVFSIELFMNLRNGEGLISNAHFAVVGPLWFIAVTLIAIAIFRKPWRASRETTKMSDGQ